MSVAKGINRRLQLEVTDSLRNRFWSRVEKGDPSECWNWTAAMRNNYGAIKHQGRVHSAHRVAYILTNGIPSEGLVIGHTCDNRQCCNPNHLEAITPGQNNRDARGRQMFHMTCGEDVASSVLTEEMVKDIRQRCSDGESHSSIARELGVNRKTVEKAAKRITWKHVD